MLKCYFSLPNIISKEKKINSSSSFISDHAMETSKFPHARCQQIFEKRVENKYQKNL